MVGSWTDPSPWHLARKGSVLFFHARTCDFWQSVHSSRQLGRGSMSVGS
jgi:hypothetical protein